MRGFDLENDAAEQNAGLDPGSMVRCQEWLPDLWSDEALPPVESLSEEQRATLRALGYL